MPVKNRSIRACLIAAAVMLLGAPAAQAAGGSASGQVVLPETFSAAAGLSGWTVYADLNNNRKKDASEPSTTSGANGTWSLADLPDGDYRLAVHPDSGQNQGCASSPWSTRSCFSEKYSWDSSSERSDVLLYGWVIDAVATGTVYNDSSFNNLKDGKETFLGGATVYQDLDGSGFWTPGEPSATSAASTGAWTINAASGVHALFRVSGSATAWQQGYLRKQNGIDATADLDLDVDSFEACFATAAGAAKCWDISSSDTPVEVAGLSGVKSVVAGGNSRCALLQTGAVKCWGSNSSGQLGDGTTDDSASPVTVSGLSGVSQLAGNGNFYCALLQTGVVKCWGSNSSGQLGDGTTDDSTSPVTVSGLSGGTRLAVGGVHVCAVIGGGTIRCWGDNDFGQLGNGTTDDAAAPVTVSRISGASAVSLGSSHSCALLSAGVIKCWGLNSSGQLGNGNTSNSSSPATVQKIRGAKEIGLAQNASCARLAVPAAGFMHCWGSYFWNSTDDIGSTWNNTDPLNFSSPSALMTFPRIGRISLGKENLCAPLTSGWHCMGAFLTGSSGYGARSIDTTILSSGAGTTNVGGLGVTRSLPAPKLAEAAPAATNNKTSLTVKVTPPKDSKLLCWGDVLEPSLDSACTNISLSSLADGDHYIKVVAADLSQNLLYSHPLTVQWTTDTSKPSAPQGLQLVGGASGGHGASQVSWTAAAGSKYSCRVDQGQWFDCVSPLLVGGMAAGEHTLGVRNINTIGNISDPAEIAITSTATASPSLSITGPVLSPTKDSLSCKNTLALGSRPVLKWRWFAEGRPVGEASALTITDDLWGKNIHCAVWVTGGSNPGVYSSAAWSQSMPAPQLVKAPMMVRDRKSNKFSCRAGTWRRGAPSVAYQWKLDGANISSATSSEYTLQGHESGKKLYCAVTATNTTGSVSANTASALISGVVDTTAPGAPVLSGTPFTTNSASNYTKSISQSITWAAVSDPSGILGYECSVDGGDYATCISPQNRSNLAEGTHSIAVRAVDNAGNTGPSTTASWKVDLTSPSAPALTGDPATDDLDSNNTNSTSQALAWAATPDPSSGGVASGFAKHECSVDDGAYTTCTSPQARSSLSEGMHSLAVRSVDAVGNTSLSTVAKWRVDTTAPGTPVLTGTPFTSSSASNRTGSTNQNITWSAITDASGVARYECAIDGGEYSDCSSPQARSGLEEGAHSLSVRTVDGAGNTGSAASASWTVDVTNPSAPVLVGAPSSPTNTTSYSISWAAVSDPSGVLRYECSVDGGAYSTCSSPKTGSNLAAGAHTLAVRTVDGAGNTGSAASASWTVDVTNPSAPALSGTPFTTDSASNYTNSTSQNLAWTASSDASGILRYECSLDSGEYAECSGAQQRSDLAEGAHSLSVRAVDLAGNTSATSTASWKVDLTIPNTPVLSGTPVTSDSADNYTNSTSQNLAWAAVTDPTAGSVSSGILRYECAIDGAAWATCISPRSRSALAEGAHSLSVRAIDRAGNTGVASTASWTVDNTLPGAPVLSGTPFTTSSTSNYTNSNSQSLSWDAVSDNSGIDRYECSVDGGAYLECSGTQARSSISEGSRSLAVRAVDRAGNTGSASTSSWKVDRTNPNTPVLSGTPFTTNSGSNYTSSTSQSLSWAAVTDPTSGSVTSGVLRYECSVDGGAYAECSGTQARSSLSEGSKSLAVRAVDRAGNNGSSATASWSVDTTNPAAPTLSSVPSDPTRNTNYSVAWNAVSDASGISKYECSLDGGAYSTCTSPKTGAAGLLVGAHSLAVRAVDGASNTGTATTSSWTVQVPQVTVSSLKYNSGANTTSCASITADATCSLGSNGQTLSGGTAYANAQWTFSTSPTSANGLTSQSCALYIGATLVSPASGTTASTCNVLGNTTSPIYNLKEGTTYKFVANGASSATPSASVAQTVQIDPAPPLMNWTDTDSQGATPARTGGTSTHWPSDWANNANIDLATGPGAYACNAADNCTASISWNNTGGTATEYQCTVGSQAPVACTSPLTIPLKTYGTCEGGPLAGTPSWNIDVSITATNTKYTGGTQTDTISRTLHAACPIPEFANADTNDNFAQNQNIEYTMGTYGADGTVSSCSINGGAYSYANCATSDGKSGTVPASIASNGGTFTLTLKTVNKDWTWLQKPSATLTRTRQTNQAGFATTESISAGRPGFAGEGSVISTDGSGTGWTRATSACYNNSDSTTLGGTPGSLSLTVSNAGPNGSGDTAMQAIKGSCAANFGSKVYSNKFYNWGDNIFFQAKTTGTGTPWGVVRLRDWQLYTISTIASGTITSSYQSCSLDQRSVTDTSVGDSARIDFVGGASSGTTGGIRFDDFTSNGSNSTVSPDCTSDTA